MEVKINRLPKSQVELEIEISVEEFNHFIEQATLNLGKDLEIKGFRKGKVPKEIAKEKIGEPNILVEAADLAVKENYQKVIKDNKIEVISQPKVDILKLALGNPFVFRAKLQVLPEVKLPDYKKIARKIKKKKVSVEEKEIDNALRWLQRSRAKLTLRTGPARKGDFVEIEYWSPQIKELNQSTGRKDAFILGEGHFIPGFEEKLIGMKAGEEKKEISVTIPKNYPSKNITGRKVKFRVKMNSVQNVEFPEIGDLFAKSLGNFENLEGLKKSIKDGLSLEKVKAESQRVRSEILEKISQDSKCETPEILIEQEKVRMLENLKHNASENLKIPFEKYLTSVKKTEKEISDSFLPEAQIRIKKFLILREIGKKEEIKVSEEEILEEVNKILKQRLDIKKAEKELAHQNFAEQNLDGLDLEKLKEYTREVIITEKIFAMLESLVGKS